MAAVSTVVFIPLTVKLVKTNCHIARTLTALVPSTRAPDALLAHTTTTVGAGGPTHGKHKYKHLLKRPPHTHLIYLAKQGLLALEEVTLRRLRHKEKQQ